MAIEISQAELLEAEDFLATYLADAVPEADFSPGSALRDICVTSVAHVFAFLRKELQSVRARQSIASLAQLPAGEDVDEAVDAILSNLFITRKEGRNAQVTARLFFSVRGSVVIPPSTRFYRADGTVFVPAAGAVLSIPSTNLIRINDGTTTEYYVDVELACSTPGTVGNVVPGGFTSADAFNEYFIRAVTQGSGYGGTDRESTTALLARAPFALATRDLVNAKAITNTLLDRLLPVSAVTVVGMGDPEMQRDLIRSRDERLKMHTGGMVDVYVKLPRVVKTANLVVGAPYRRHDAVTVILRDNNVNFLTDGRMMVVPGNVLRVTAGLGADPSTYIIEHVTAHELTVRDRTPFAEDTTELGTYVSYTVGTDSPNYDDIITSKTTGQTTKTTANAGIVVIPEGVVYDILEISYSVENVRKYVTTRVNGTPATADEFSISVPDLYEAQSLRNNVLLHTPDLDGVMLEIKYDSVAGLDGVQGLLSDPAEKTAGGSHLARAMHPVYVSLNLVYSVKLGYTDPGTEVVKSRIVELIEEYDPPQLTAGNLIAEITRSFTAIAQITPPVIRYRLLAPDGQVLQYESTDRVSVTPDTLSGGRLANASTLRMVGGVDLALHLSDCVIPVSDKITPAKLARRSTADLRLKTYLSSVGVSDRTIRYAANPADITVSLR